MGECKECGEKIDETSRFCQACGLKIKRPSTDKKQKKSLNVVVLILMFILVLGIGIGIGFLLYQISAKDKYEDGITADSMNEKVPDTNDNVSDTNDNVSDTNDNVPDIIVVNTDLTNIYNCVEIGKEVNRKYHYLNDKYPEMSATQNNYDYVEGWIEGDSEIIRAFNYSGLHFTKLMPRDIRIVSDYGVGGRALHKVTKIEYKEEFLDISQEEVIPENACYLEYDNVVKFTKEYLMTLAPGYYEFRLYLEGSIWPILIIVHDESEAILNYRISFDSCVGFYSTESKNDVLFYMNGSTSQIKNVLYGEEDIKENDCEIVCDGYGLILYSDFLEKHIDKPYIELTIITEANIWCTIKVIFLNHAS